MIWSLSHTFFNGRHPQMDVLATSMRRMLLSCYVFFSTA